MFHTAAQRPSELSGGLPGGRGGFSVNEIGDRLGLNQIQTAIEECALGKFPRPGLPDPLGKEGLQTHAQHSRRTVTLDLSSVLSCVAPRAPGYGGQSLIDGNPLAVMEGTVDKHTVFAELQGLAAGRLKDS